jgi:4-hydroxy-2-oxoheptanedioate aldolase
MLKQKIDQKGYILGTWAGIPSATVIDIIGNTGFDFVVIDQEHGAIDPIKAEDMIRAAQVNGMVAIVRVSSNDSSKILRIMDLKADGIQVPHVSSAVACQNVIQSVKYYPLGGRGYTPFTRAGGFGLKAERHAEKTNANSYIVVNLEGMEAIENIEKIAKTKGVDVLFVGPYDLSQSLGIPGRVNDPEIFECIAKAVKVAEANGMICGAFANDENYVKKLIDLGVKYITCKVDCNVLASAYKTLRENIEGLCNDQK